MNASGERSARPRAGLGVRAGGDVLEQGSLACLLLAALAAPARPSQRASLRVLAGNSCVG